MPFYDLYCSKCNKEFNIMASMTERTERRIVCPDCGSRDLEAVFKTANFYIKNESRSECPHGHICGANCAHN